MFYSVLDHNKPSVKVDEWREEETSLERKMSEVEAKG